MAIPAPRVTVEQFFEDERRADWPSEYHDGEVFPLEAVSINHSRIGMNLKWLIRNVMKSGECAALETLHVRVTPRHYLMPDAVIVCGEPILAGRPEAITNPKVIFEILSPSTGDYDRGSKFEMYTNLESFVEYVVIAQDRPSVRVYRKTSVDEWTITKYDGLELSFPVVSIGLQVSMSELYEQVNLERLQS